MVNTSSMGHACSVGVLHYCCEFTPESLSWHCFQIWGRSWLVWFVSWTLEGDVFIECKSSSMLACVGSFGTLVRWTCSKFNVQIRSVLWTFLYNWQRELQTHKTNAGQQGKHCLYSGDMVRLGLPNVTHDLEQDVWNKASLHFSETLVTVITEPHTIVKHHIDISVVLALPMTWHNVSLP